MFDRLRQSDGFAALMKVSRRLGNDPMQIQGPGGNTSLKDGNAMWIKASGTWLAEANARDIMAPCDAGVLRQALDAGADMQPETDTFVPEKANSRGLRPSIETAVHAALDWPVVLHTHCVSTIALAVCADGSDRIAAALPNTAIGFVPYVRPGWDLAKAIRATVNPEIQVIVLGNHGLVVCGETVGETEKLLRAVSAALQPENTREPLDAAARLASRLDGTGWTAAPDPITHAVARDPVRLEMALGATLYPDHLIFLGPGCRAAPPGADPLEATDDEAPWPCRILLFPDEGAAVPKDATPAVLAMARCLGDVLARVPTEADLTRLDANEEAALLNWDAEKYRQALNEAAP